MLSCIGTDQTCLNELFLSGAIPFFGGEKGNWEEIFFFFFFHEKIHFF